MRRLMKIRNWIAAGLAVLILLPCCALADQPVSWMYSFSAGEVLTGEGMDGIRDFLDAVQLGLTTENRETRAMGEAVLYSVGKPVFTLRAMNSEEEESFGLYCSLMGECALMCRQDQVTDFLMNLVQMLADLSVLKENNLPQARSLAGRAGEIITNLTVSAGSEDPAIVLDLGFYLEKISDAVAPAAVDELDGTDPDCPGAARRQVWHLNEEELDALVKEGIGKLKRLPLVSDVFLDGRLKIGGQSVTEDFLLELFASVHGDTEVTVYTDAEEKILRMRVRIPDISDLVENPEFGKISGLEFSVERENGDGESRSSVTEMRLLGLEQSLITIHMLRGPGEPVQPLPTNKVFQVGEMNSEELWDMIRGLGFTIAGNAINMVMDLPRVVFDTLVERIF